MKNSDHQLTAEQFAAEKFDLPEGGRWHELVAGEVVALDPPDEQHGNVVLNLSKALAEYFQQRDEPEVAYACFELGLIVARNPDTVLAPPISVFVGGEPFAESDRHVTETRPAVLVEVASTNDRRRAMKERVRQYLDWGVDLVWVVAPLEQQVHTFGKGRNARPLDSAQVLSGTPILNGFSMPVKQLFQVPEWWTP